MNKDLKVGYKVMLSPETKWNVYGVMNPLDTEGVVINQFSLTLDK